jgi:hypothetical protein
MANDVRYQSSFDAVDDAGNRCPLHVYADFIDAGTRSNPKAQLEGLKQIRTGSGGAVNRLDKGRYKVLLTGQVLSSDDPRAP